MRIFPGARRCLVRHGRRDTDVEVPKFAKISQKSAAKSIKLVTETSYESDCFTGVRRIASCNLAPIFTVRRLLVVVFWLFFWWPWAKPRLGCGITETLISLDRNVVWPSFFLHCLADTHGHVDGEGDCPGPGGCLVGAVQRSKNDSNFVLLATNTTKSHERNGLWSQFFHGWLALDVRQTRVEGAVLERPSRLSIKKKV